MSKECKKCKKCADCQMSEQDMNDEWEVSCYCGNEGSMHYGEHRYYGDEACEDLVPYSRAHDLFCKYVPYAYLAFIASTVLLLWYLNSKFHWGE